MAKKNNEVKKKRHLKWQIKMIIIIIAIALLIYFIGTKGVFIKEHKLETSKIDDGMHGLKIVQFSDVHFNSNTYKDKVKLLVNKINEIKPDIVVFTGDLIDKSYKISNNDSSFLKKELTKINAELGKYYVTGENDNEFSKRILNISSFINLDDTYEMVYKDSKKPIILIGKNGLKEELKAEDKFKLLLLHDPNDIKKSKGYTVDAALAGHTHNGQINIPKLKELFIKGNYYKNYQIAYETKLFINPGIGTSKVNVRMFNHPTIYLYRLYKTNEKSTSN